MSKMSELAMVLSELKQCGESLMKISDELTEIFSSGDEAKKEPEKKKAAKKAETAEPVKEYSFTDVRTILAEKSRAGHTAEIKEILTKHGADKLSGIKPEDYAALVAEVEVL